MRKIILIFILVILFLPLAFAASPSDNEKPTLKLHQTSGRVDVFTMAELFSGKAHWKLVTRLEGQVESLKEFETPRPELSPSAKAIYDLIGAEAPRGGGSPIWQSRLLHDGDKAITGPDGYAKIILADESSVTIGPNTVVDISLIQLPKRPLNIKLKLMTGKLIADVKRFFGEEPSWEIPTPNGILGSRGTKFEVEVKENKTFVSVYEGIVKAINNFDNKTTLIYAGQVGILSSAPIEIKSLPELPTAPLQIVAGDVSCAVKQEFVRTETVINPFTKEENTTTNTTYLCLSKSLRPTFTFFSSQFLNPDTVNSETFKLYDESNQLQPGYLDIGSIITFIPSKPLQGKIKVVLKGGEDGICTFSGSCLPKDAIFDFQGAEELESPKIPFELTSAIPIFIERNIIIKNDGTKTASEMKLSVPSFKSYPPASFVKLFKISTKIPYTMEPGENDFIKFDISELLPGKSIEINVSYTALLFGLDYFSRIDADKIEEYTDKELFNKFTQPERDIEVDNPEIRELSKKIVGEETNPFWKAFRIYSWITDTIAYDYEKGSAVEGREERLTGALLTLQTKKGICYDYAKLFVALARAAGVPSRYVTLYVQRDKVVGHAYAEIYLPPYGWIPLDPTFGVEFPSFAVQNDLSAIICKQAAVSDCNIAYTLEGFNTEGVKVSLPMEISGIDLKDSEDWQFFFKEPFFEDIYHLASVSNINKNLDILRAYNTELNHSILSLSRSGDKNFVHLVFKAIRAQQDDNYIITQPEIKADLLSGIKSATENWLSLLEQLQGYLQQKYPDNLEDPNFVLYYGTTTIIKGDTIETQEKNVLLKDVLYDIDSAINKSNATKYFINNNDFSTASKQLEESYLLLFGIGGSAQSLVADIVQDYRKSLTAAATATPISFTGIMGVVYLFIIFVIPPLFWVWMWVNCLRRKEKFRHLNKIWWFLIVFFGYPLLPVGAVIYFFVEYRKRNKISGRAIK